MHIFSLRPSVLQAVVLVLFRTKILDTNAWFNRYLGEKKFSISPLYCLYKIL